MKNRILALLASLMPFGLSKWLFQRKFMVYGHLVTDAGHIVGATYRYPSLQEFDQFINRFQRAGYRFVSLADYLNDDGRRKILLTFDDGFKSIYDDLHPYLLQRNIPYLLFVLTDPLSDPAFLIKSLRGGTDPVQNLFLSEKEILQLKSDGVHIGFHTRSHRKITDADMPSMPAVGDELTIPAGYRHLFSEPVCFAYPYMAPDDYKPFDSWMGHREGYAFFFDTKGFKPSSGNHFFRVSIDAERTLVRRDWMFFVLNRQLLSSLFQKYFKR